jgi:hypothetical protein
MLLCVNLFRIVSRNVNERSVLFVLNTGPAFTSLQSFHLPTARLRFSIALDVLDTLRPCRKISDLFVNVN